MNKWILFPALLLGGCASLQQTPAPLLSSAALPVPACEDLLSDYETYADLDEQARARFVETLRGRQALSADACEQLRLALVWSQGGAAERARALKLVEDLLDSGALLEKFHAQPLALLLHDRLRQERRLALRNLELQQRLKGCRAREKDLARQLEDLRSQLRQLKQIEQNINEKEQSLITPAADKLPARSSPDPGGG